MTIPRICSQSVFHQSLAYIPVIFSDMMFGILGGWYTPILSTYRNSDGEFSLTDNDCSWIVSLQFIGMITGSFIAITSVKKTGCCLLLLLFDMLTMISWSSVALFKVVFVHLLVRFSMGMSVGVYMLMRPIWIGENSSPRMRAIFGGISVAVFNIGFVLSCILGTYCSYELSSKIIVAFSLVNLASTMLSKEPAQRLIAKGREIEGEKRFLWLRGDNEETKKELEEIKIQVQKTNENGLSFEFLRAPQFSMVCILTMLMFSTGWLPPYQLAAIILMPTEKLSTNELSVLLFIFRCIGSILSPLIIDRFKRRTLWIVSAALCFLFQSINAVLYYLSEVNIKVTSIEWILFGSIAAYVVTNVTIAIPLQVIAVAELLPQKQKTVSIFFASSVARDIINTALGQTFLPIASNFGMKTNFIFFAISSVVLCLYTYFYVPETKHLSLVEIEKSFEKRKHNQS